MTPRLSGGRFLPTRFHFLRHVSVYLVSTVVFVILDLLTDGNWWNFWVMVIWFIILSVHYFAAGTVDVDDDWANERVEDLRVSSYDYDHIGSIKHRVKTNDPSVTPHTERES